MSRCHWPHTIGAILLKWPGPVSSRDRSFWPNTSGPRKKNSFYSHCLHDFIRQQRLALHSSKPNWNGPGQSRHMRDRPGRIRLARLIRMVKVIVTGCVIHQWKTRITQQQTTLTDNTPHFSNLRISASSNANPVYHGNNDAWTTDSNVWLTVLCSCISWMKLLTTDSLHSATEVYRNYTDQNITSFMHK